MESINEVLKKIELDSFNNRLGLKMGMAIVDLAKERNLKIAVQIDRLNHTVFLFLDDHLSAEKHNWLRRKTNVTKHFEESSLSVKNDLTEKQLSLEDPFGLSGKDYIARGGCIPVFVKNAGMIATITVSGLPDVEDHQLIVDALKGKFYD